MSKISKLEEIANIIDSLHQTPNYSKEGISMIRVTDIKRRYIDFDETLKVSYEVYKEFIKKYTPKKGDIIMTRVGSYGSCSYISTDEKFCLGQNTVIISPKINGNYLYYSLISSYVKNQIESFVTGSTQKTISLKDIKNIEIRIPSDSNVINSIAKILSDLDSKIEINNRINTELEAMAKTLYDYWFVQFDFPNANGKPYKSSGGEMVYNSSLKRKIPVGWEVKKIGDVTDVKAGGDKPKDYSVNKTETYSIPIYSNGITNEGLYGFTNNAKINKQSLTVSARGTIGYCVLRNKPFVPIIRLIVITPNNSYEVKYFYEFIKNLEFENSGSVQQQLTVPQISSLNIILPPSEILKKYDLLTSSGINKIEINKEENQVLASLRDWLLPMLMNGQVSVGEIITLSQAQDEELRMVAEERASYGK